MNRSAHRRNQQVLAYLDLVSPIARYYSRASGQDQDDLIQVGRLGLLKAAQQFNAGVGSNFKVYAKAHIRGAILHYLRDNSGLVRLPRRLQEQAQQLIRQGKGQTPAEGPRLTAQESIVLNAYKQRTHWADYDEQCHPQRNEEANGWQRLARGEQTKTLTRCWRRLPKLERDCVHAVVVEGTSLRTTAKRLGTSAMTVQRRVKHGLQMLASECQQQGLSA